MIEAANQILIGSSAIACKFNYTLQHTSDNWQSEQLVTATGEELRGNRGS